MGDIPVEELYTAYVELLRYSQIARYIFIFQIIVLLPIAIYCFKYRMDPYLKRKLKWISKQRRMNVNKHIYEVLEVYVAEFAERNDLDWNDYVP